MWKMEELLVMSNFSFSRSVSKKLVLQTCKNQDLFGKGLKYKVNQTCIFIVELTLITKPFPNKPWFIRVCSRSLLKTMWEKEKLLNFKEQFLLFPQVFSNLLENILPLSSNSKLSAAGSLSLEESKTCLGKG